MNYFSNHWTRSAQDSFAASKIEGAHLFLQPLLADLTTPCRRLVLDAGCGNGVHAAILCDDRHGARRFDCVGLDLSQVAVSSARQQCPDGFEPVRGDMMKLPFPDQSFDAAIAFGSLAYTPEPYAAFVELVRITKPGGRLGIWLMEKQQGPSGVVFSTVRALCKIGGAPVTELLAALIVPLLPWLPTKSRVSLRNATWQQCREVVMVNIAPPVLSFFDQQPVREWFIRNDMAILHEDTSNPITIWGVKRGAK